MEDLIERIHCGEVVTILIGYQTSQQYQRYLQAISHLPLLYPNLSFLFFNYEIPFSSSPSPAALSASSSSPLLPSVPPSPPHSHPPPSSHETKMKFFHQTLCRSSLLFLIEVQLQCTSPMDNPMHKESEQESNNVEGEMQKDVDPTETKEDDEGKVTTPIEFNEMSQTLLYHLQRENLHTYCLHSLTKVISLQQTASPSTSLALLLQLTRHYLNETKMIHLVSASLSAL
jgi:hypothetical protein